MNREELAAHVADRAGVQRRVANTVMGAVFETIADALDSSEKITIAGFGTFEARERAGRVGRNPRTGETIQIPPRKVPVFTAGKGLRDRISAGVGEPEMISAEPGKREREEQEEEE